MCAVPQPQPGGAEVTSRPKSFASEAVCFRPDEGNVHVAASPTKKKPSRADASLAKQVQDALQVEHRRRANEDGRKSATSPKRGPLPRASRTIEIGVARHRLELRCRSGPPSRSLAHNVAAERRPALNPVPDYEYECT